MVQKLKGPSPAMTTVLFSTLIWQILAQYCNEGHACTPLYPFHHLHGYSNI